jgi:4-hydroxythreonine-4-phosphate dehydrogenase
MDLPILAVTMGDPAGIGPEVIAKALSHSWIHEICRPLVVGDPWVMERACRVTGSSRTICVAHQTGEAADKGAIAVLPASREDLRGIDWGRLEPRCGRAQVDFIRCAATMAMKERVHAMVTGPIHKKGLQWADVSHPGHTEMLADWTGAKEFAMMLVGDHLRVVPVTLHIALKDAVASITRSRIRQVVQITHGALGQWFGLRQPRLAVAGLNPHAGDEGLFGDEEKEIIEPAVRACREEGFAVEGPLPPDSVFRMAVDGRFDAVVAMYHDQGLIPLKLLDRDNAVNLTLGLPIIRTSVDHGTAYDIAGTGQASEGSLLAAMKLAAKLASIKFGVRSSEFGVEKSEPATGSPNVERRTPDAEP